MKLSFNKQLELLNYFFFKYKNYLIFFYFLIITTTSSLIFSYKFSLFFPEIVKNNFIELENIPFNHGNLINNLLNHSTYKVSNHGIDVYLDRLPFVAFITIIIAKISSNIYLFLFLKNILLFSLLFYFFKKYYDDNFSENPYFLLIFTSLIFCNFYNFQTSLNFVFAEGYLSILLPCLFIILINQKLKQPGIIVSIFIIILFFAKTTMIYLTISLSIMFIFFAKTNKINKYLPIITLIFSMFAWGIFGYIKTGKFPFLNSISSTNQEGLALVLNERFGNHYPKSIDILYN